MLEKSKNLAQQLGECIYACNNCLASCLEEEDVKMMTKCISLDKECADICGSVLQLLHKNSNYIGKLLSICSEACKKCAEECRKHPKDHCQECAQVCEECAHVCENFTK